MTTGHDPNDNSYDIATYRAFEAFDAVVTP